MAENWDVIEEMMLYGALSLSFHYFEEFECFNLGFEFLGLILGQSFFFF